MVFVYDERKKETKRGRAESGVRKGKEEMRAELRMNLGSSWGKER